MSQQLLLMVIVGATPNVSIANEEHLETIVTDVSDSCCNWFEVGNAIGQG